MFLEQSGARALNLEQLWENMVNEGKTDEKC